MKSRTKNWTIAAMLWTAQALLAGLFILLAASSFRSQPRHWRPRRRCWGGAMSFGLVAAIMPLVTGVAAAFVAYGRWCLAPGAARA